MFLLQIVSRPCLSTFRFSDVSTAHNSRQSIAMYRNLRSIGVHEVQGIHLYNPSCVGLFGEWIGGDYFGRLFCDLQSSGFCILGDFPYLLVMSLGIFSLCKFLFQCLKQIRKSRKPDSNAITCSCYMQLQVAQSK